MTGYLIWGYLIIYIFIVAIGLVILSIRVFFPSTFWLNILKKPITPTIIAIVIKQIVKNIASQLVFLNRNSKILAIDNFRAFNVFLYFNFFFDCFMGAISAIIRLIKAVFIAILMLPSEHFYYW